MMIRSHITRVLLILAAMTQALFVGATDIAEAAGFDARPYICNFTDNGPNDRAQAEVKALLQALGKIPADPPSTDHCEHCTPPLTTVVTSVSLILSETEFTDPPAPFGPETSYTMHAPRGPPLGERAPPSFQ